MGTKLPQSITLLQKVVKTCQFVNTIEYIQPTQNTNITVDYFIKITFNLGQGITCHLRDGTGSVARYFFRKGRKCFLPQYIEQEFSHPKFYPQTFEKLDCFGAFIQLSKGGIQLLIIF